MINIQISDSDLQRNLSNLPRGSENPNMKESDEAKHETREEGAEHNDDVGEYFVQFSRGSSEDKPGHAPA